MSDTAKRPLDLLESSVGNVVTVHLKGGKTYEGVLESYDQHMNLVVDEGEDITIIRGDNVVSIQP